MALNTRKTSADVIYNVLKKSHTLSDELSVLRKNADLSELDIKFISEINNAVKYVGENSNGNITVLSTYTALLKIDKIKEMKKCY